MCLKMKHPEQRDMTSDESIHPDVFPGQKGSREFLVFSGEPPKGWLHGLICFHENVFKRKKLYQLELILDVFLESFQVI